jgi:hypothetical protein
MVVDGLLTDLTAGREKRQGLFLAFEWHRLTTRKNGSFLICVLLKYRQKRQRSAEQTNCLKRNSAKSVYELDDAAANGPKSAWQTFFRNGGAVSGREPILAK